LPQPTRLKKTPSRDPARPRFFSSLSYHFRGRSGRRFHWAVDTSQDANAAPPRPLRPLMPSPRVPPLPQRHREQPVPPVCGRHSPTNTTGTAAPLQTPSALPTGRTAPTHTAQLRLPVERARDGTRTEADSDGHLHETHHTDTHGVPPRPTVFTLRVFGSGGPLCSVGTGVCI